MSKIKLFEMMVKLNPDFLIKEGAQLEEDYPASFSMEEFKKLTSFAQRIKYCEQHLTRLGSGSARVVYKIDDQKVLKLAKNKKGLDQNRAETDWFIHDKYDDIVTKCFDSHQDNLWIEMELAQKARVTMFPQYMDFTFQELVDYIDLRNPKQNPDRSNSPLKKDPERLEFLDNHEFMIDLMDMIGGTDVIAGDFDKISSYGLVTREDGPRIVLVDYGLTKGVWDTHYAR